WEAVSVIEMPQVCELVTEGADQARVFEGLPGGGVPKADADGSIRVADAVAPLRLRCICLDGSIAEPETRGYRRCITVQPPDECTRRPAIHPNGGSKSAK